MIPYFLPFPIHITLPLSHNSLNGSQSSSNAPAETPIFKYKPCYLRLPKTIPLYSQIDPELLNRSSVLLDSKSCLDALSSHNDPFDHLVAVSRKSLELAKTILSASRPVGPSYHDRVRNPFLRGKMEVHIQFPRCD